MNRKYEILAQFTKNQEVLDIGCSGGGGTTHEFIKQQAHKTTGLDLEPSKGVIKGDAQEFNLNQQFEVITALNIIEHLPNPGMMLKRCHEHLKTNGKLIIMTNNAWALGNWFRRGQLGLHNHVAWYCERSLRTLFTIYGFEVYGMEYFNSYTKTLLGKLLKAYYYLNPERMENIAYVLTKKK